MSKSPFFKMSDNCSHPIASINSPQSLNITYTWTSGKSVKGQLTEPIIYQMDFSALESNDEKIEAMDLCGYGPDDFNIPLLSVYSRPPLICKGVAHILTSFDNSKIELFEAEIHNPKSGTIHRDYYAFNLLEIPDTDIVREIQRENLKRSIIIPPEEFPIFYLYDDGPLIVNEQVKNAIIKSGIEGLDFEKISH